MKRLWWLVPLLIFSACQNEPAIEVAKVSVPGYWFHLIFIVIPLGVILVKLFIDLGSVRDSLIILEGQGRRLLSRIEELEDRIKSLESGGKKEEPKEKE